MMLIKQFGLFFLLLCCLDAHTQQLFESGVVYGGVTGGGFSTNSGSGTVTSTIAIPPNSTIKKAYLLATRDGIAPDISVVLNGLNYTFSNTSVISNSFISYIELGVILSNSTIHALDITNNIDSSILSYSLAIPPQFNQAVNGYYSSFYLYIIYENPTLPKIAYDLFVNQQNVSPLSTYNLINLPPVSNGNTVGLGLFCVFFCDTVLDGSYVAVNGNALGLLGGDESNSLHSCTGTYANFAHYNDSLFGLEDDTPDSLMAGTDALADIKSYVNNGDTTVNVTFTYQSNFAQYTNPIAAIMLSYSTPCDTFSTAATTNTDTICAGETIQLQATGGATYNWFSAFSTFNDSTLANPVATPTQTTTYIVTIKNALGCVKTEHVKVWVHPKPKPDTITTTPQRCGSANGSITVGNIANNAAPYNYQLTNLQTLITQNSSLTTFNNLLAGNYLLQITDSNGCQWQSDTLFVPEINDITVNFSVYTLPWVFPEPNPLGTAPLTVYTQNASVNTNLYEWTVREIPASAGMTLTSGMANPNFNFDSGGTFEICLLAYNNIPVCGDTVCKTVVIASPNPSVDSLVLIVPNVFSPNGDGSNDNFVLQVQGASLLESLNVEIFNRWGQEVQSLRFDVESLVSANSTLVIWDGTTTSGTKVPEGTYFYVVSYTKLSGEKESLKGTVTLLR